MTIQTTNLNRLNNRPSRSRNYVRDRISVYKKHVRGKIKECAKSRKHVFDLTDDQVWFLCNQECVYCGAPPSNITYYKSRWNGTVYAHEQIKYNGLDRVDNSKGYLISNVVPCCKICNIAKRKMSVEEFQSWIRRVYNRIESTICKTNLPYLQPKVGYDLKALDTSLVVV